MPNEISQFVTSFNRYSKIQVAHFRIQYKAQHLIITMAKLSGHSKLYSYLLGEDAINESLY